MNAKRKREIEEAVLCDFDISSYKDFVVSRELAKHGVYLTEHSLQYTNRELHDIKEMSKDFEISSSASDTIAMTSGLVSAFGSAVTVGTLYGTGFVDNFGALLGIGIGGFLVSNSVLKLLSKAMVKGGYKAYLSIREHLLEKKKQKYEGELSEAQYALECYDKYLDMI